MDAELSPAFVLHTRRYGDTSLLVELYGRGFGRASSIAKGALTARRAPGRLQPFQPLLVALRGRGEVRTLKTAEVDGSAVPLRGKGLFCGLYLNELLLKLTVRDDPNAALYDDYQTTLSCLSDANAADVVLRRFELQLLQHLGHALVLDRDVEGRPIQSDAHYTYQMDAGPVRSEGDRDEHFSGRLFDALRQQDLGLPEIRREARVFMRQVLDHYLDGRPIRTRDLFR